MVLDSTDQGPHRGTQSYKRRSLSPLRVLPDCRTVEILSQGLRTRFAASVELDDLQEVIEVVLPCSQTPFISVEDTKEMAGT
jgi:hypothetical protein